MMGALGSLMLLGTGTHLFLDDLTDFPDLSRPHHWQYGLILIIIGLLILAFETFAMMVRFISHVGS